ITRENDLLARLDGSRLMVQQLAHEIKNPLGGLRGAAQLLERELPAAALKEYTQVIIAEADRLTALVDSMSGPSRAPSKSELNVHEICEHVYHLLRAEAPGGILIERDYDPSLPDAMLDRHQLIQALLNVARNALQAQGEPGRQRHGPGACGRPGPGDPRRRHHRVRKRAGAHGVHAAAAPGRGHMSGTALRVWLVDDDASIRWVLERALRSDGMAPRAFEAAEPALDALRRESPDVLITDIRMPGASGLELLRRIRDARPALPVIVMTGPSVLGNSVSAYQAAPS